MRIIFLLLIAGLCLATAKYVPRDSIEANSVLYRVRRSDSHDSDSDTASVERDDDSSNDNDNEDDDGNDSAEKIITKEQKKLREKEEKKRQKLLEKIEKEKQKEIEERRKLEEKLAKEQRKVQETKEKEERKLQERIEKERQKLEEENRKKEQKLEKEEKKRQEKLKKKLEKLQKEQKESAEDTYLETEEEDSVEMEDIWKVHVYDKYGLNITSTKLERQAALQRYLQEEMGINVNSTKSERRQAILKLIQTKLQNDSIAVDSFRNLLLSHVNAAQIQKLKSKLENDLEELNNQTELLNNISLPWVTVAQQNVEEKRTFLQAIAQFLSNIVPNWFIDEQFSNQVVNNSTQLNGNGLPENNATTGNSNTSIDVSASGQPLQSVANDNDLLNQNAAAGESNLSVLPSNVGSASSTDISSRLSNESSNTENNNVPNGQINANGVLSSTANSVTADSSTAPTVSNALPNSNVGSGPSNNIVPVGQANVNEKSTVTDNSPNLNLSDTTAVSSGLPSINPSASNEFVGKPPLNNINPAGQIDAYGQAIVRDSSNNSGSLNVPEENSGKLSTGPSKSNVSIENISSNNIVGQTDSSLIPNEADGDVSMKNIAVNHTTFDELSLNIGKSASSNSLNKSVSTESGSALGKRTEPNSLNNIASVRQTEANGLPSNINTSSMVVSPNTSPSITLESIPDNPLDLNIPVSQADGNGQSSNTDVSANIDNAQLKSSKPSELNGPIGTDSVNNVVPVSENNDNGQSSGTANTVISNLSNTPTSIDSVSTLGTKPSDTLGNESLNKNVSVKQVENNETPVNNDNLANVDSLTLAPVTEFEPISSISLKSNDTIGLDVINNIMSAGNELLLNTSTSDIPISSSGDSISISGRSTSNPLEPKESGDNKSVINLTIAESGLTNVDVTQATSTLSDVTSLLQSNEPNGNNLFESNVTGGQADIVGKDSVTVTSVNSDLFVGSSGSVNQSGTDSPPTNVTSSQSDGIHATTETAISATIESINVSSNAGPSTGTEEISNALSIPTESGVKASLGNNNSAILSVSEGKYEAPAENSNTNANKLLNSENSEHIPKQSIIGAENVKEAVSTKTSSSNRTSFNSDSVVQITDGNLILDENTVSSVTVVNNDLVSTVNNSILSVTDKSVTSNVEAVTEVISMNTQTLYHSPTSQNGNVLNTDAGITLENADAKGQNTDSLTTSVIETKDVTVAETQTEQGILLVQEILNTPSDSVTIASVEAPLATPPTGVIVPVEAAASIVDMKVQ